MCEVISQKPSSSEDSHEFMKIKMEAARFFFDLKTFGKLTSIYSFRVLLALLLPEFLRTGNLYFNFLISMSCSYKSQIFVRLKVEVELGA